MGTPDVNFCGFETGDTFEVLETTGTFSIQSSIVKNGTYALRTNPTTTGTGRVAFGNHDAQGQPQAYNVATAYYRFYFYYTTKAASNFEYIFAATDSASNVKFALMLNSSGNLLAYGTGATTLLATGSTALNSGTWYRIECRVETGSSVAWEVKLATGDSTAATEISGSGADLRTGNNGKAFFGKVLDRNANTVDYYYDDIGISSTGYPGPAKTVSTVATANGTYTAWTIGAGTGSKYLQVDEIPHDLDTTYLVSTLVSGDAFTGVFNVADSITLSGGGVINAVKILCVCKRDGGSNSIVQTRLRSATTNSDTTIVFVGAAYDTIRLGRIATTDPATSSAWNIANMSALEAGVVGADTSNKSRVTAIYFMTDVVASPTTQAAPIASITFTAIAPTVSKASTGVSPAGGPFLVLVDWFDDGSFTRTGDNVTGNVMGDAGVFWSRGKDQIRLLSPPAAGDFNAALMNRSGDYWPSNSSSPLFGNLVPGRKVRVVKSGIFYSSTDRVCGTFILDDLRQHPTARQFDVNIPSVEIPSKGTLSKLVNKTADTALYQNITTSAALTILLDRLGWPSGERTIDTGLTTLAWWWLDDEDGLSAAIDLLGTEGPGAAIYEDPNGYFVFEARDYRTTTSRCTSSQASYGDGGSNIVFLQPEANFKDVIEAVTVTVNEREVQALDQIWSYNGDLVLGNDEVKILQVRGSGDPFMEVATPTEFGTNEVQTLTASAVLTAGTFTLEFQGQVTGNIQWNATAADIQAELEGLSTIGAGNMLCGGGPINTTPVTCMFRGTLKESDQPLMTMASTLLNPVASPATIIIVETNPDSPGNTHTIFPSSTPLTAGSFRLDYHGIGVTTASMLFDSSAAVVQSRLENTSLFDPGDVSCSGGPISTDDIVISYTDSLFGTPLEVPRLINNGLMASQPSASIIITETVKGTGPDYVLTAGAIVSITFDRTSGAYVTMTITAGPAGATLSNLRVRARPVTVVRSHQVTRPTGTAVPERRRFKPQNMRTEISIADAETFAQSILDFYDAPRATETFQVFTSIFSSAVDASLAREISDRITLNNTETGIASDFFIERIKHSIQGLVLVSEFGCEQV